MTVQLIDPDSIRPGDLVTMRLDPFIDGTQKVPATICGVAHTDTTGRMFVGYTLIHNDPDATSTEGDLILSVVRAEPDQ